MGSLPGFGDFPPPPPEQHPLSPQLSPDGRPAQQPDGVAATLKTQSPLDAYEQDAHRLTLTVRRAAGISALVLAGVQGLMWLLSFVPNVQTPFWNVIVGPCFVVVVPLMAVAMWDGQGKGRSALRAERELPLQGWRAHLLQGIFFLVWVSVMATMFSGSETYEAHGRYYERSSDVITEVSREEWLRFKAEQSRWFSGSSLVLASWAGLLLMRPSTQGLQGRSAAPDRAKTPRGRRRQERAGLARMHATAKGLPEGVVAAMQGIIPVHVVDRRSDWTLAIHGNWDSPAPFPTKLFPLRVDGTLAAAGTTSSRVDITIEPATKSAYDLPGQGRLVLAMATVFVALATALAGPYALMFFSPLAAWAVYLAYIFTRMGREASARAVSDILSVTSGVQDVG